MAGHAGGRSGGVPGPRQRAAKPAADGVDRGRADDRARARDARRDARGRHRLVVPRSGQRPLHRGLRDHRAEQLLADPDRRRRGGGEGAGRARRRKRTHGGGASERRRGLHHRRRPGHGRGHRHGLDGGLAGGHPLARRRRRVRRRRLGEGQRARSRLGDRDHVPERHDRDVPDQGDLRPADRRVAVRQRDDLRGCLGRAGTEAAEPLLLPEDGGRRDGREPGRPRRGARRLPEREGADAAGSSSTTRSRGSTRS